MQREAGQKLESGKAIIGLELEVVVPVSDNFSVQSGTYPDAVFWPSLNYRSPVSEQKTTSWWSSFWDSLPK